MIRCLLSRSGKKYQLYQKPEEHQSMVEMTVGLPSMNITGNTVDGKLYSMRETTTATHSIVIPMVNTMTLCLLCE
jgi:hypothetical protein